MNSQNPFDDLMHQINDLLQIVAEKADKPIEGEIPADIEEKLRGLEKQVENFKRQSKAYISSLNVSEEDMEAYKKNLGRASVEKQNEVNQRTENLKGVIEQKKALLEKMSGEQDLSVQAISEDISLSEKKDINKNPSRRKGLFKRAGGNKDWRPL